MGTMSNNVSTPCEEKLGNNLKVLEQNDQIKELQTIIRDRQEQIKIFIFYYNKTKLFSIIICQ